MIVYQIPAARIGGATPDALARGKAPITARLRPAAPWTVRMIGSDAQLALAIPGQAPRWPGDGAEWHDTPDGLRWCAVGDPLPLDALVRPADAHDATRVALRCGLDLPIRPAYLDGSALGLDRRPGGAASAYGRQALNVADQLASGAINLLDQAAVDLALMAARSVCRLTDEMALGIYQLIGTADLAPILEAVWRGPKPPAERPASPPPRPAETSAA